MDMARQYKAEKILWSNNKKQTPLVQYLYENRLQINVYPFTSYYNARPQ